MIKQSLILGLLTLSACGPLNENNLGKGALAQFTGIGAEPETPKVTPDIANAAPGDILLVTIRNGNLVAPLVKAQNNGDTITWISPGDVSMTFRDGILISTRGLAEDLMGADIPGVRAAIRAGGGTVTRRHSFLDSLDQIVPRDMTCIITRGELEDLALISGTTKAVKYEEACTGGMIFTNQYWVDPNSGDFLRTLQVVSGGIGFIQADQL